MKKKQEIWPWAIVAVFVVFITFIVWAGVRMMNSQVDLVSPDYYQDELVYQDQINKEILTRTLEKEIAVEPNWETGLLTLIYPLDTGDRKVVAGDIHLFRPSDAALDKHYKVVPDQGGQQIINLNEITTGLWRIKINWKEGPFDFYHEEHLFIKKTS